MTRGTLGTFFLANLPMNDDTALDETTVVAETAAEPLTPQQRRRALLRCTLGGVGLGGAVYLLGQAGVRAQLGELISLAWFGLWFALMANPPLTLAVLLGAAGTAGCLLNRKVLEEGSTQEASAVLTVIVGVIGAVVFAVGLGALTHRMNTYGYGDDDLLERVADDGQTTLWVRQDECLAIARGELPIARWSKVELTTTRSGKPLVAQDCRGLNRITWHRAQTASH
jgi:hypothetical protein